MLADTWLPAKAVQWREEGEGGENNKYATTAGILYRKFVVKS